MKKFALFAFFIWTVVINNSNADTIFSTGTPDGKMAFASRPASPGKFEIESADDFVLTGLTQIDSASFYGLLPPGATIGEVAVEIYRVFPNDSDTGRTPNVPTRNNSPSDNAFADRDTALANLTFSLTNIGIFSAANSVQPGGIHPSPGQTTGGNGPVTGNEVEFNVNFTTPLVLPADHYFFVPQVQVVGAGDFYWLSAPRPTQFPPGFTDLQAWTRDQFLDPDWLRVGQDIVGGTPFPTFNGAFSLNGSSVPDAGSTAALLGSALAVLSCLKRRA